MHWSYILFAGLVLAGILFLKRLAWLSAQAARARLQDGALLVDVRSADEFKARHLPGALNLPLSDLAEQAPRRLPDKNRVLLLHCLSGTRSSLARRALNGMGYPNVFNLGSYGRAQRIVKGTLMNSCKTDA
jgi:rhodanese-related sulfurtransferase